MASSQEEKIDIQAQEGLVSSLLFMPDHISEVVGLVSPDDFTDGKLATIFSAMLALNDENKRIEMSSVLQWLTSNNLLNQIGGGSAELIRLFNEGAVYGSQTTIESYAGIVKENSSRRSLKATLEKSLKSLKAGNKPKEILSETQNALNDELLKISNESSTVNIATDQDEYMEHLRERMRKFKETNGNPLAAAGGIPTGYKTIDDNVGGLMGGQLITIGGRTGIGKSFLAVAMAIAAAIAGKTVLFFSLEMQPEEVMNRFVSNIAEVKLGKLINGSLSKEDVDKVEEARKQLSKMKIIIDATPNIDADYIRGKAMKQAASPDGLGLVIVDYLQLMTPRPSSRGDNRERQVADMSRNLKLLAMQMKIPVIDLVQLNREKKDDEDPTPTINDIRESNSIAQDSSVIILIHRNIKADNGLGDALFIIGKNRNGRAGVRFRCHTMLSYAKFVEIDENGEDFGNAIEQQREGSGETVKDSPKYVKPTLAVDDNGPGDSKGADEWVKQASDVSLGEPDDDANSEVVPLKPSMPMEFDPDEPDTKPPSDDDWPTTDTATDDFDDYPDSDDGIGHEDESEDFGGDDDPYDTSNDDSEDDEDYGDDDWGPSESAQEPDYEPGPTPEAEPEPGDDFIDDSLTWGEEY